MMTYRGDKFVFVDIDTMQSKQSVDAVWLTPKEIRTSALVFHAIEQTQLVMAQPLGRGQIEARMKRRNVD